MPVVIGAAFIALGRVYLYNAPFWTNGVLTTLPPRTIDYVRWIGGLGPPILGIPVVLLISRVSWQLGSFESRIHNMNRQSIVIIAIAAIYHAYKTVFGRISGVIYADTGPILLCTCPLIIVTIMWTIWSHTTLRRHRHHSLTHYVIYVAVLMSILGCLMTIVLRTIRLFEARGDPHVFECFYLNYVKWTYEFISAANFQPYRPRFDIFRWDAHPKPPLVVIPPHEYRDPVKRLTTSRCCGSRTGTHLTDVRSVVVDGTRLDHGETTNRSQ